MTSLALSRLALLLLLLGGSWILCGCRCDEQRPAPDGGAAPSLPARHAVALVAETRGTVEVRRSRSLRWERARPGSTLYARDSVRTGQDGFARVTLRGTNSAMELGADSLVIIEPPARPAPAVARGSVPPQDDQRPVPAAVARVDRGTVTGVLPEGAAPLALETPDGTRTLLSAGNGEAVPFRARLRKDGTLELAVFKGPARVQGRGEAVELSPGQAVDVAAGGAVARPVDLPSYPDLVGPLVDAKVRTGQPVVLSWSKVPEAAAYRVQLSGAVGFVPLVLDRLSDRPQTTLDPLQRPQTLYWRVCSVDGAGREGEFGFARRFHVQQGGAVQALLEPADGARVEYVRRPLPIDFSWRGSGRGSRYRLVVGRAPELSRRPVVRRVTRDAAVTVPGLGQGTYYWGVYRLTGDKPEPLFYRPFRLRVVKRSPPKVKVPRRITW